MPNIKFTKSSFVRNLSRGKVLLPHLERFTEWDVPIRFEYEPKGVDDAWHPSGDCLPSPLELYTQATTEEPKRPHAPSLQRTFLVGHFWHQVIQDALIRMELAKPESIERQGVKIWGWHDPNPPLKETAPRPYHWATGRGDVAPLELPNWSGVVDIKTMRTDDFKLAERSGQLPDRFRKKYEAQINIYMDFFDLDKGLILGVNKDNSSFCEFVFERNQPLIDLIYFKWRYVGECLTDNTPPLADVSDIFELPFSGPSSC